MRLALCLVSAILMLSVGARAEVAQCGTLEEVFERGACCHTAHTAGLRKIETCERSGWVTVRASGAFEPAHAFSVLRESDAPLACSPAADARASLSLRCRWNETGLSVRASCPREHWTQKITEIRLRIGAGAEQTLRFEADASGWDTGLWQSDAAIALIRQMLEAETVEATFELAGHGPQSARFDLAGLAEQIAPLRALCGW